MCVSNGGGDERWISSGLFWELGGLGIGGVTADGGGCVCDGGGALGGDAGPRGCGVCLGRLGASDGVAQSGGCKTITTSNTIPIVFPSVIKTKEEAVVCSKTHLVAECTARPHVHPGVDAGWTHCGVCKKECVSGLLRIARSAKASSLRQRRSRSNVPRLLTP